MSGKVDWKMLDEAVCQVFKVRVKHSLESHPLTLLHQACYSLAEVLPKLSWSRSLPALRGTDSPVLPHVGLHH